MAASLVAAACVSLVGKLGDAFAPLLLAANRPVALLILNSNDAHSALTAADLHPAVWLAVIVLRRGLEDGFYFSLGRVNGVAASSALGLDIHAAGERWKRLSFAVLLLLPSAPVCILLGAGGTAAWLFALVDLLSIVGRAACINSLSNSPLHAMITTALNVLAEIA